MKRCVKTQQCWRVPDGESPTAALASRRSGTCGEKHESDRRVDDSTCDAVQAGPNMCVNEDRFCLFSRVGRSPGEEHANEKEEEVELNERSDSGGNERERAVHAGGGGEERQRGGAEPARDMHAIARAAGEGQ